MYSKIFFLFYLKIYYFFTQQIKIASLRMNFSTLSRMKYMKRYIVIFALLVPALVRSMDCTSQTLAELKLCTICQYSILPDETERALSCAHSIHNSCYAALKKHSEHMTICCPNCRSSIRTALRPPQEIYLCYLWKTITQNPDNIQKLPVAVRSICQKTALLVKDLHQNEVEKYNAVLELFLTTVTAISVLPSVTTVCTERERIDDQLTAALEVLKSKEKELAQLRQALSKS